MVGKRGLVLAVFSAFLIFGIAFSSAGFSEWFKSTITGRLTEQGVGVNISISNTAPSVITITAGSSQSITEDGKTRVMFNITANDPDGFLNFGGGSFFGAFNKSGEGVRQNASCININNFSTTYANFSCTVDMWYFDASGDWSINGSVKDVNGAWGTNNTFIFSLGQTSAFNTAPGNLTFASIGPGSSNQTSNNDPLVLNNTGNKAITVGNIQVNVTNLMGETNAGIGIYAGNVSIGSNTGSNAECDISGGNNNATIMVNSTYVALNISNLTRGNHSANDGNTAQEYLYVCLRSIGSELTSQAYSTLGRGPWTIKIV